MYNYASLQNQYHVLLKILQLIFRTFVLLNLGDFYLLIVYNCIFLKKGHAFDPMGNKKAQCMMGPDADCDRCGCIVPFYLKQRTERKYILQEVWGDLRDLIKVKKDATSDANV